MSEPNYGNVYDYHSGAYIRAAARHELTSTLARLDADDPGAFLDRVTGAWVYVADEDADVAHELIEWLAANEDNNGSTEDDASDS